MAHATNVERDNIRQAVVPRIKWKATSNDAFMGTAIIVGMADIRSRTVGISPRMRIRAQQDTSLIVRVVHQTLR